MRCFIAIDIDQASRKAIGELQLELQDKADVRKGDVKWVKPELMHLTLKFLGEIKDEQSVDVCNIVKEVTAGHNNFELDIESVGSFGGRSARLLWLGTGQGTQQLFEVQEDLEKQLAEAGWPPESRKFTGHLTICRIKNPKAGYKLGQLIQTYGNYNIGNMPADAISVYQSELTPTGPIYTVLGNYKLQ